LKHDVKIRSEESFNAFDNAPSDFSPAEGLSQDNECSGVENNSHLKSYRLDSVASKKQLAMFVVLQIILMAILLWLSITVLEIFLSKFFEPTTIYILCGIYAVLTLLWQTTYVYRIFRMKRAVLIDRTVPSGLKVAMATTIVPSREYELLHEKLESMVAVDSCNNTLDLWVLDEENDTRVSLMIDQFNERYKHKGINLFHFSRKEVAKYQEAPEGKKFKRFQSRQKGGNINAWLDSTRGKGYDIISMLDLDHMPCVDFYKKVLPYFQDKSLAFLQSPEAFRNRKQNFISRAASFERDTFFGLIHRSYFGLGMPVIVGSHTTFRADTFDALGGFYPVHLTEDYLIMLRLRALGKHGVFIDEELAVGELPTTWNAYLGQQQRWASGGLDLLMRYYPSTWKQSTGKERLFMFVLLNYYAWGTFFILSKLVLYSLVLNGMSLNVDGFLFASIVGFIVFSMAVNFLWERQFYFGGKRRRFLLENMFMNNFLGGLYFFSFIKAIFIPNTSFNVTAKSHSKSVNNKNKLSLQHGMLSLLFFELIALIFVWRAGNVGAIDPAIAGYNILIFPLLVSFVGNCLVFATYGRNEKE